MSRYEPLIQVQAVSQRFNTASGEFWRCKNVSLIFTKGKTIGLIGHSMRGKSTLLNLLLIAQPTEGGLLCDNCIPPDRAGGVPEPFAAMASCFDNGAGRIRCFAVP